MSMDNTTFVGLPTDLVKEVNDTLMTRGSSVEQFLTIHLQAFLRQQMSQTSQLFGLDDTLPWGKYAGTTIDVLVRTEPGYIQWLIDNSKHKFSDAVHNLLAMIREQDTLDRAARKAQQKAQKEATQREPDDVRNTNTTAYKQLGRH